MSKIAFYDAKAYDKPSFEHYGSVHGLEFKFLETKLNEDTVELAKGCDAVCVFVNDTVNAAVIEKLYEYGVKLVALRSAGYNNVDVQAAFGKIHQMLAHLISQGCQNLSRRLDFFCQSQNLASLIH